MIAHKRLAKYVMVKLPTLKLVQKTRVANLTKSMSFEEYIWIVKSNSMQTEYMAIANSCPYANFIQDELRTVETLIRKLYNIF